VEPAQHGFTRPCIPSIGSGRITEPGVLREDEARYQEETTVMKPTRIIVHAFCAIGLLLPRLLQAQISNVEFGPVGGPYQTVGHYDNATASWVVDNSGKVTLVKDTYYQFIVTTNGNDFTFNLVGTDWANFTYDQAASSLGSEDKCGIAVHCAVLRLYCGVVQHWLGGPDGTDEEQSDNFEICTKNGANSVCRPVGRFNCENSEKSALIPGQPTDYFASWGDELHVPANAVAQPTSVVLTRPSTILHSPDAVPGGYTSITESIEISPATLLHPATVVMRYSAGQVRGGQESSLTMFRFDQGSGTWQPISSVLDTQAKTLTFQTQSFGVFGYTGRLLGPEMPSMTGWALLVLVSLLLASEVWWLTRGRGSLTRTA
jgi:hypothetical protein